MKRLTFKPEFVPKIQDGTKTATARWSNKRLNVGDIVAAVTATGDRPAFLTKAEDRFATLLITKAELILFKDLTEDRLAKTTVDREWYLREMPGASDSSGTYYYEWELSE